MSDLAEKTTTADFPSWLDRGLDRSCRAQPAW